jgi:hypothetical protein
MEAYQFTPDPQLLELRCTQNVENLVPARKLSLMLFQEDSSLHTPC